MHYLVPTMLICRFFGYSLKSAFPFNHHLILSRQYRMTKPLQMSTIKEQKKVYVRQQQSQSIPPKEIGKGALINEQISKYLSNPSELKTNLPKLQAYIIKEQQNLMYIHMITLLQRASKNKVSIESVINLSVLNSALIRSAPVTYNSLEISNAIYGLRSVFQPLHLTNNNSHNSNNDNHSIMKEKNAILSKVSSMVEKCAVNQTFTGQEIANAFYG